jgi:hypothetical protein
VVEEWVDRGERERSAKQKDSNEKEDRGEEGAESVMNERRG